MKSIDKTKVMCTRILVGIQRQGIDFIKGYEL